MSFPHKFDFFSVFFLSFNILKKIPPKKLKTISKIIIDLVVL